MSTAPAARIHAITTMETAMHDVPLGRLLHALDAAVEHSTASGTDLQGDLELAALRLTCLRRRLGPAVAEDSAYLAFLRRTVDHAAAAAPRVAVGA
jgi:hypothetical protein